MHFDPAFEIIINSLELQSFQFFFYNCLLFKSFLFKNPFAACRFLFSITATFGYRKSTGIVQYIKNRLQKSYDTANELNLFQGIDKLQSPYHIWQF